MKKLSLSVFLFFLCSLTTFAASKANIHITYDPNTALVRAQMSIADGDAIVGHFGLRYDPSKLRAVTADGEELPEIIPDTDENGNSYLTQVVEASSAHIVITAESEKPSALIDPSRGTVLFGWYASKTISAVSPETDNGRVACVYFRMGDGVEPQSLTVDDIAPALSADCEWLSGWKNGVMLIDSESRVYTYEKREGAETLAVEVLFDIAASSDASAPKSDESDTNKEPTPPLPTPTVGDSTIDADKTNKSEETDKADEGDADKADNADETDGSGKNDEDKADNADNFESGSFSLSVHAYEHTLRFIWDVPEDMRISYFTLTLVDSKGNAFREIGNLIGITRSITVQGLAPNFSLTAHLTAYATSGSSVKEIETDTVHAQTAPYSQSAKPLIYTVTYDPGIGELYGFESEKVLFGESPSKVPTVYPPEGYRFVGWSGDGKSPIETETLCIYENKTLVAVFEATNE